MTDRNGRKDWRKEASDLWVAKLVGEPPAEPSENERNALPRRLPQHRRPARAARTKGQPSSRHVVCAASARDWRFAGRFPQLVRQGIHHGGPEEGYGRTMKQSRAN